MKTPTIEFYLDGNKQHRWQLKHGNGKILDASSEGFSSKGNAKRNLQAIRKALNAVSLAIVGLLILCGSSKAQTNTMPDLISGQYGSLAQQFYDATIGTSNGVFVATAARKLTGNANRFSIDYIYSFNNVAGLILGIDDIRSGGKSYANVIKGGLNLQTKIYPFKNFGATNFFITPYAFVLIATPIEGTSNNGGIGQLAGTGISFEQKLSKNLSLELGAFYENSVGEGQFSGNWFGILGGLHYHF